MLSYHLVFFRNCKWNRFCFAMDDFRI